MIFTQLYTKNSCLIILLRDKKRTHIAGYYQDHGPQKTLSVVFKNVYSIYKYAVCVSVLNRSQLSTEFLQIWYGNSYFDDLVFRPLGRIH